MKNGGWHWRGGGACRCGFTWVLDRYGGFGGSGGGRGGGGGRRRRCCSGAEVVLREVMSLNAHGVHAEQMPPSEGADVEGF